MKKLPLIVLFSVLCGRVFCQSDLVEDFANYENLKQASIGLLVVDLKDGREVASYQPAICRNPASVTKVITTATAMELLSDTFRFQTCVCAAGEVSDSVLYGNLIIRGGGDPTLCSAYNPQNDSFYIEVANAVRLAGIRQINGAVVGDATLYREDGAPFNWLVEDVGSSYSPTPSALAAHDNLLGFALTSDSSGLSVDKVRPGTQLFRPVFEATQADREMSWRFSKSDFSWNPVIRGNFPLGTCQYLKTEIPEPALFVADSVRKMLQDSGVVVQNPSATARMTGRDSVHKVIHTHYSAQLRDIERVTNHKSINLYAENIFLYLSRTRDTTSQCVGWSSAGVIAKYWRGKQLESDKIFQVDGSGMSTKNAISPRFIVGVLSYMYKESAYSQQFFSTLPIAGRSGTVASFMKGTKLEGKVHAKSGSMERVQNYAGYILYQGKEYAFCVMVSNFSGVRKNTVKQIANLLNGIIVRDAAMVK